VSGAQEDPLLGGGHLSTRGRIALGLQSNCDQIQVKAELTHMLVLPDALVLLLGRQQYAVHIARVSLYQLLNKLEIHKRKKKSY
jgi:hypothetical protein